MSVPVPACCLGLHAVSNPSAYTRKVPLPRRLWMNSSAGGRAKRAINRSGMAANWPVNHCPSTASIGLRANIPRRPKWTDRAAFSIRRGEVLLQRAHARRPDYYPKWLKKPFPGRKSSENDLQRKEQEAGSLFQKRKRKKTPATGYWVEDRLSLSSKHLLYGTSVPRKQQGQPGVSKVAKCQQARQQG